MTTNILATQKYIIIIIMVLSHNTLTTQKYIIIIMVLSHSNLVNILNIYCIKCNMQYP